MNGIDDLRRTLADHAADRDDQLTNRAGAVRRRVHVVRRRRAGALAVAAAAVLAVSTLALGPDGDGDGPVSRTLASAEAPATMTSLGYTYDYAIGAKGGRKVNLELPESDQPRLVSWAAAEADDVTVRMPSGETTTWDGPDFSRWTIIPGGTEGTVSAAVDAGEVEVAVYDLTDARPAGVTDHGATFRDQVAGRSLIAAAVGAPGESSTSVSGVAVGSVTDASYFCTGAPQDAWMALSVNGKDVGGGSCSDGVVPVDVAGNVSGQVTSPGERVEASLSVTAGEDGPVLEGVDDLQVGIGLYEDSATGVPLGGKGGLSFDDAVESGGHLWRLDRSTVTITTPGTDRLDTPLPTDRGPILVAVLAGGALDTTVKVSFGEGHPSVAFGGGGGTSKVVGVAGGTVTMEAARPTDSTRLGTALYVLAD